MCLYRLAEALHEDIDTVRSWPYEKIRGWLAYFAIKAEENKKNG